jgi:hypothetical protein
LNTWFDVLSGSELRHIKQELVLGPEHRTKWSRELQQRLKPVLAQLVSDDDDEDEEDEEDEDDS